MQFNEKFDFMRNVEIESSDKREPWEMIVTICQRVRGLSQIIMRYECEIDKR